MTVKTLQAGMHSADSGEFCLMEAVSIEAGEVFSDTPETACPVLASFGRALNDAMPDDETRSLLLPLVPLLIGTRDPEKEQARAFFLADRAVRLFAPLALDAAGLAQSAHTLRNLPAIVDDETARAAEAAAWAASRAATAAWEAVAESATAAESAESAAWAAVWAATRAAESAESAVWATAEASAGSAGSASRAAMEANDWILVVAVFREAIAL